jgi:hypothetical protein
MSGDTIYKSPVNLNSYKNLKKLNAISGCGCHNISKPTKEILNVNLSSSPIPLRASSMKSKTHIASQMAQRIYTMFWNTTYYS